MRVICIGDSNTYGQNVCADEAWPAVLADMTGYDVRNEGLCGETTRLGLERFPKAVQLHRPDWVIIQYGHNDANVWETDDGEPRVSARGYAANVREMEARAAACGAKAITLLPHDPPDKPAAYRQRLQDYRAITSGWLLDPEHTSILQDGYDLHPDRTMHREYAKFVAGLIG